MSSCIGPIVTEAGQLKALPRTATAIAQVFASFMLEQPCESNINIYTCIHDYKREYILIIACIYSYIYT